MFVLSGSPAGTTRFSRRYSRACRRRTRLPLFRLPCFTKMGGVQTVDPRSDAPSKMRQLGNASSGVKYGAASTPVLPNREINTGAMGVSASATNAKVAWRTQRSKRQARLEDIWQAPLAGGLRRDASGCTKRARRCARAQSGVESST